MHLMLQLCGKVTLFKSLWLQVPASRLISLFALQLSGNTCEVLVTDNGTPFTSTVFAEFTRNNGIRHVRVSPYHPSSNGLA